MYHDPVSQCQAKFASRTLTAVLTFALLLLIAPGRSQAQSLNQRVLVVYNSANSDSTNVANYYVAKRGIPSANLCAIAPPSTVYLAWSDFVASVKTPIQNCLNTVGPSNILYIVFTYQTPYDIIAPDGNTYALDQFVGDIWDVYTPPGQYGMPSLAQPYYANAESQGYVYIPFVSLATYRASANSILIYSVWRLDAATAALAQGLVDNALLAESNGLSGQVCIDEDAGVPTYDYSYSSVNWDLIMAAIFGRQAGFSVTEDRNPAEFGTSPAPLTCDGAALYSGWYSYNNYNNAFTWNPGAIGFHLDSAAAANPRGGTNWSANALINGITVTSGAVAEPDILGWAHPDGVFRNLFEGANVGDAFLRNLIWLKWMILNIGDPLYRPFPSGFSAVTAAQNSFALTPQFLAGGSSSTGLITLAAPAPATVSIALKADQPALATVPSSVSIAAGQTTASFPIQTSVVTMDSPVLLSAVFGSTILTNTLIPQALLAGVGVSPGTVTAGSPATGTVFLNFNAPAGGIVVGLSSNSSAASVPATVPVPAGMTSATFNITTSSNSGGTTVTISALYAGATATATLIIGTPVLPVISGVTATAITSSGATINWTTNLASTSQVAYGLTNGGYTSMSALGTALVTTHSVNLSGLAASTTYHYQVLSGDSQGVASSADFMFTTAATTAPPTALLQLHADASEVSGVTNGSIVTPSTTPAGFTGKVVLNGSGSVNFTPAEVGNGVYFLNCCANTNNAYYKFTGATVGNVFNVSQGQVSFYLKSRYTFAQRQASAATPRYAFDVRDANGHLFYYLTEITSGRLLFTYNVGGGAQFYYVPQGTEDTLFGTGVILQVTITWNGSLCQLYFNNALVQSSSYTKPTPNWTAASIFDLGAYEYLTYGGYDVSDDVIDEFTVSGPAASDTTPPTVSMTAPANGATVAGTVPVSATATDNVAMAGVQFQLDGANLGAMVTGAGPSYSVSWNTTTAANGTHTLSAVATDTSGNTATSSVSVTVNNLAAPPVLSSVTATSITSSGATITWTTDQASDSQVAYGPTNTYGSLSTLATALVTAHSVSLSGLSASTLYHYQALSHNSQGTLGSSGDFTFTTAAVVGPQPALLIQGNASEVSGVTNGSIVTPSTTPAGFTGEIALNGSGSVNFTPAQLGNGVYFLNCCTNTGNAYYKFTGATVGNIFNASQGQVSFYLQSRYTFAQRSASASTPRYTFDVRDANGHLFYFLTEVSSGRLLFSYTLGGGAQFYYAPKGTEDVLFGSGIGLNVLLTWSGGVSQLYFNNVLVQSAKYTPPTPNWTAASNFDFGAYEYLTFGGYDVSDDVINQFTVWPTAP
jgi:uncharacterized protein (TIGR03790 family)